MRCNLKNRNQIIEDYLNGRLAKAEREAFDEHLFNCDVCYRELRLREEMIETIKKEGAMIFQEQIVAQGNHAKDAGESLLRKIFPTAVRRPAFAFAALVLFVAISALVLQQWLGSGDSSTPVIAEKRPSLPQEKESLLKPSPAHQKTTEPSKTGRLYAANFQPSPMFEEMLSSNLRSSALNILAPQPGQKVESGHIRFEWQGDESGPFYVKILDNRGREVAAVNTEQRRVLVREKLPPGLYYWKLETEEDLLFLGKFVVPVPGKD